MAILTLGDKKIAIGVEWSVQESKSALRKACAEKKNALQLVIPHDDGFVLGQCEDSRANDLYAGAGIIAHAYRNAVLCEKIEGLDAQSECFWICAVSDGVPLPGKDKLLNERDARAEISDLMSFHPNAVLLGTYSGSQARFHEILEKVNAKTLALARLQKAMPVYIPVVVGVIVVVIAVSGVIIFAKNRKVAKYDASRAAVLSEALKTKEQHEKEVRDAAALFESNIQLARLTLVHQAPPAAQVSAWLNVLRNIPVSIKGWTPTEMSCDLNGCKVSWQKGFGATALGALAIPGGVTTGDDNRVEQSWPMASIDKVSLPGTASGEEEKLRLSLISIGDIYKWSVRPDPLAPVQVIPPEILKTTHQPVTVGRKGKLTVDFGDNTAHILKALHFVDITQKFPVSFTSMRVTGLNGQYNVRLEGNYVVFQDITSQ